MSSNSQPPMMDDFPSPETIRVWIEQWIAKHHPNKDRLEREAVRDEMLNDLPYRFLPERNELFRQWWTKTFQTNMNRLGYAFLDGNQGKVVAVQPRLPWREFEELSIYRLRLSAKDVQSVQADLEDYVQNSGTAIDVPETMERWKMAAGL